MSKLRIVQFLRICFIGVIVTLVISEFNRCGGGGIDDEVRGGVDKSGYNDDDKERGIDRSKADESRTTREDVFGGEGSEDGDVLVPLRIKEQVGISDKIDFIFVIDSSLGNIKNISHPKIREQLGDLPEMLSAQGIDWQMYFLNSKYDLKRTSHNGALMKLESNGGIIPSNVLNPKELETVYLHHSATEVFIDTIEHGSVQKSGSHCQFPPYCFYNEHNRPLSALNLFITRSRDILRPDADVMVVVLTNDDEKLEKAGSEGGWWVFKKWRYKPLTNAGDVIGSFENIFSDKNIYAVSIIVTPESDDDCKRYNKQISSGSSKVGSYVSQLSMVTKGRVLSICPHEEQGSYMTSIMRFIEELREDTPIT